MASKQVPPRAAQTQPKEQGVHQTHDVHGRRLQELESEVRDLATKVDTLEQAAMAPPSPSDSAAESRQRTDASLAPQTSAGEAPKSPQTRLQDVLPELKNLAQKVGGMEQLAQIIETLKPAKE
jgi:hypothetical protein